jgi:hypothetical protein
MGGWESFTESAQDITNHGIDGGFHGFIYYNETEPFARRNREAIAKMASDQAEEFGTGVIEMIRGFGCFRNGTKPTDEEIGSALYAGKDAKDGLPVLNALAWYAGEEVARSYCDINRSLKASRLAPMFDPLARWRAFLRSKNQKERKQYAHTQPQEARTAQEASKNRAIHSAMGAHGKRYGSRLRADNQALPRLRRSRRYGLLLRSMRQHTPMTSKPKSKAGRPKLPEGVARVPLHALVKPVTFREIERLSGETGKSKGKLIDERFLR